jgi:hypothetical protein
MILKNIYQVTQEQYNKLMSGETVGGHAYDANTLYLIDANSGNNGVVVDEVMSDISANPVQNKIIKEYVDKKTGMQFEEVEIENDIHTVDPEGKFLYISLRDISEEGRIIFKPETNEGYEIGSSFKIDAMIYLDYFTTSLNLKGRFSITRINTDGSKETLPLYVNPFFLIKDSG